MYYRLHLAVLAFAAALSVLIFFGVMLVQLDERQRAAVDALLAQAAGSSLNAVQRELNYHIASLRMLADSVELDDGLSGFRHEGQRMLAGQKDWLSVGLIDAAGRHPLVVSRHAVAVFLPPPDERAEIDQVIRTRQPAVGGIVRDKETGQPAIVLRAPLMRDGKVHHVLSVAINVQVFTEVMLAQAIPEGWTGVVIDANRVIVGRTRAPEAFVGTPVTASLAEAIAGHVQTAFFSLNKEGNRVYTMTATSPETGWTVAIGVPDELVEQSLHRPRLVIMGGGALAVVVALMLATILIRGILRRQEMERRLISLEMEQATSRRLADVAANLPGLVFRRVLHPDGRVSYPYMSEGAHRVLGIRPSDGTQPLPLEEAARRIMPEDSAIWREALLESARSLRPFEAEGRTRAPDGSYRWVRTIAHTRRQDDGSVLWDGVVLDITDLKETEARLEASLSEKETLLREIHHRVKNNLQVIWSLIQLEAMQMDDDKARQRMEVIGQRISVLGRIHQQLYASANLERIDFGQHLEQLAANLRELHAEAGPVTITVDAETLCCDLETAIPLGLIANEVIANSLKHAFPHDHDGGLVTVSLHRAGAEVELVIADNGIGFAVPGNEAVGRRPGGLGTRLIQALTGQIDASVSTQSHGAGDDESGTRVTVTLAAGRFIDGTSPVSASAKG